uniref:Putative cytochrome n=1 Tax=Ixodes ricinus TaxID=34613 RepID=A0A147BN64_IXORI
MESALWMIWMFASTLLATCGVIWVLKRRHRHGFFKRLGIPGPEPELLFGNWQQLRKDRINVMEDWIQKYGKTFGYFKGAVPFFIISDVEMIKQCVVKEAQTFYDRPEPSISIEPYIQTLLFLKGDEWKKVRTLMNPSFTSAKMKLMTRIIDACADEMLDVLSDKAKDEAPVDVGKVSCGFSLDVIAKCALAWQVDCQKNPDDPIVLKLRHIFDHAETPVTNTFVAFPFLRNLAEWVYPYTKHAEDTFAIINNLRRVVELRRRDTKHRPIDMLQLLLDAQAGKDPDTVDAEETECDDGFVISDDKLLANSFILLIAGFETTATSLGFILHLLSQHPDEQETLHAELVAASPNERLDYDRLMQLRRLDMVVQECLRLYPPVVLLLSRACRADTTIMGQFFPKGANIMVPVWHIHHDPELWPDPFKFDPERFGPDAPPHHPAAFIPFGLGPRMCLGMRFALLELKTVLCKIIRKYRIVPCGNEKEHLELTVPIAIINPKRAIKVRLHPR